jgi:hypothetical protein
MGDNGRGGKAPCAQQCKNSANDPNWPGSGKKALRVCRRQEVIAARRRKERRYRKDRKGIHPHLSTTGAMPSEMLAPKVSHRDEHSEAVLVMTPNEATLIGVLQTGRRGQEVRHASITSEYGLDSAPIHSSKSSIRASTGSANAASLAAIRVLRFRLVGIVGEHSTQAA